MRTRRSYWDCGPFAAWVRRVFGGYGKPVAGTSREWRDWNRDMEAAHPRVYWFTERFLSRAQDILCAPLDAYEDVVAYLVNRWLDRTHVLSTRLEPGGYYELDRRFLHGLFEAFCDYVECEKAWKHLACAPEAEARFGECLKGVHRFPVLRRFARFRCPGAGLAYLDWEASLGETSPEQAECADLQKRLYRWWREDRPARPDPADASGMTEVLARLCPDSMDFLDFLEEHQDDGEYLDARERERALIEAYGREDDEMLVALIRIRRHLWT